MMHPRRNHASTSGANSCYKRSTNRSCILVVPKFKVAFGSKRDAACYHIAALDLVMGLVQW